MPTPLRSLRIGKNFNIQRGMSTFNRLRNVDREGPSPQEILEAGFRKMESAKYTKSDKDLESLVNTGKQLGVPESDIKQLYKDVRVGDVSLEKMSPEQRFEILKADAKALGPPSLDEPYEYDDLPPLGHMQLHLHRIQREYNRVAAYDLPQLTKYVSEYKSPSEKNIIRFKYFTYLGEKHPGENRVVGTFKTADLDLTDAQRHTLRVLARNRYNPTTDEMKIGTSRFTEQAQNKRYIGKVIRDLIKASKEGEDTFSDIPLDTRHIEPKTRRNKSIYPQYEFPKEWERPQDAPSPKQDLLSRITEESSWSKHG